MKSIGYERRILALGLLFFGLHAAAQQEFTYQGASLRSLVNNLNNTNDKTRQDARLSITQIGTNALPYLMSETRALGLLQEENKTNFDQSAVLRKRHSSLRSAFQTLGPVAKPAVPEMVSLLNDGTCPLIAGEMLALIDTNAASTAFIQAMTSKRLMVRFAGADYLVAVGVGTNEDKAVAELIQCLSFDSAEEKSFWLRSASAGTLGGLKLKPEVSVPALIDRLRREKQPECRVKMTKSLGEFGTNAIAAIPLLRQMTNDSDAVVKHLAVKSLKQIEGNSP